MNGQWLGARAIRVNWATQKTTTTTTNKPTASTTSVGMPGMGAMSYNSGLDFATVLMQTTPLNTTVYIGNIGPETSEQELRALFSHFGQLEELRLQADKGYGFARYPTHEIAAAAIVGAHGTSVGQRQIKCSWGKERTQQQQPQPQQQQQQQQQQAPALQVPPFPFFPPFPGMPGMPAMPPGMAFPPFPGGAASAFPQFFMPPAGMTWPGMYQSTTNQ